MKKIFCVITMLCAITIAAFGQSPNQRFGILRELIGEVELKPAGASEFVSAKPGDEIAADTVVSTGFKSSAVIEAGISVITVRPLTRLSLAEIQTTTESESLNMELQTGRVKVDVKPPAGTKANFTVRNPIATASVRGTSFEFDTRSLRVSEGRVSFRGSRGLPIRVPAGSVSSVGKKGKAINPTQLNSESLQPPPPVGTDTLGGSPLPPNEFIAIDVVYPRK